MRRLKDLKIFGELNSCFILEFCYLGKTREIAQEFAS